MREKQKTFYQLVKDIDEHALIPRKLLSLERRQFAGFYINEMMIQIFLCFEWVICDVNS